MPRTGLTAQDLRAAAIDITVRRMREHGFDKVRLSDVAREMRVSHAALYAHFADKAALLDAVTQRWLDEVDLDLAGIAAAGTEPTQRIREWFVAMYRAKRERVRDDPELYRAFDGATALGKPFIIDHLRRVQAQLIELVAQTEGQLGGDGPERQAALLYEATMAFHHPKIMLAHGDEDREQLLDRILDVLLRGLGAKPDAAVAR